MTRHLYVHVPFCAHRCGYCDFVTVSHQPQMHDRYVAALAGELELRREELAMPACGFSTIFVGGGTPTLLQDAALEQLLAWCSSLAAPGCELTVECNPETVDDALARRLVDGGVTRVSLGAQSFQPHVLKVLERRASPDTVRDAVTTLRAAGIDNLSLDVLWGVPGQSDADLRADLDELVRISPNHVSAYELEFKPGTRVTHRYGTVEEAVGDASDEQYDVVVDALTAAGYEWYETANFARDGQYSRHNLAYWTQADYAGIGIGAVGTIAGERRTNMPSIARYVAAVEEGTLPPARIEPIDEQTRRQERIMLGLRLARPVRLEPHDLRGTVDADWLERLHQGGMLTRDGSEVQLTRRGRMMLNSVLAHLLA